MGIMDLYYTVDQAAAYLKVTVQTMRQWVEKLRIPNEKVGETTVMLKEDIHGILKYKILASLREVTGKDEVKLCDDCMAGIMEPAPKKAEK